MLRGYLWENMNIYKYLAAKTDYTDLTIRREDMKTKEANAQRKGAEAKDKESKPNKRFSRRDALKAGLALVGAAVLKTGCSSEYKANKDGGLDGSTSDASGLDANVSHDASMLDGSISQDASILPDAHIPDATVQPDSAVSTCVATQVEEEPHLLSVPTGNSFTVGEYTVTWTGTVGNTESTTADVACTADNAAVATNLTLQKGALVDIQLDATMKMTLQFSAGGQGWVVLMAGISQI